MGRPEDTRSDGALPLTHVRAGDGTSSAAPEAELDRLAKSLKDALFGGRLAAAAEDIVRMLREQAEPARIALEVAAFDALHGEHGSSEALPVAADAARVCERYPGERAALPLLLAAELALDGSKHRSARKVPASQDPGREAEQVGPRLCATVEAGDAEAADALVRGALWRKWGREHIEPWFHELHTAHFFAEGRGLIATVRAFELLERVGFEHARRILPGLTFALARMPRTDSEPEWQWFRQRYSQLLPRLAELWARAGQRVLGDDERRDVSLAILDGSREEAWHKVIGVWASGGSVECVLHALSRAAAERWWRFDPSVDRDPARREGWLDAAQPFAYVHALRAVQRRHARPGLLKMVLYGVCAVNRAQKLDLPADRWTAVDAKGRASFVDRERLLVDLADMVRERSPVEAQRAALAFLALGGPLDSLRTSMVDLTLRDRFTRPVYGGQGLRLAVAACDEAMSLPERERSWPIRALVRMLASPVCEHSLEGLVLAAQRAVRESSEPGADS